MSDNEDTPVTKKPTAIKKAFEIKKWTPVVTWKYDIIVDTCAICRNNIMELCIDCVANVNSTSAADCNVGWGRCGHAFHFHCISRWLKTRNVCPLDNKEWDYEKFSSRSN